MPSLDVADLRPHSPWRIACWSVAAAVLAAPLVAMQFTGDVDWDATDFIVFGAMLLVVGLAMELIVHLVPRRRTRLLAIGAAVFAFLWLWAELAVGVFTQWEAEPLDVVLSYWPLLVR